MGDIRKVKEKPLSIAPGLAHKPKPTALLPRLVWNIEAHLVHSAILEYKKVILSLLDYNPNASLVDLGCLEGDFTKRAVDKIGTDKVEGIDIDIFGFPYSFHQYDLNKGIPMEDGTCDVILASHILEHLVTTDLFVKEIYRVLRPGGYAVISTDNLSSWHNIFYLILGGQPETLPASDELFGPYSRNAHKRVLTMRGLVKLFKYHGFIVEKVIGSGFYPLPKLLARLACKLDKFHSVNTTIKVRKP